jgi:RecJ-like exonuclease
MMNYIIQLTDAIREIVESSRECERCDGTGKEPDNVDDACRECGGTGEYAIVATIPDLRALLTRTELTQEPPEWTREQKATYQRSIREQG